MYMGVCAEREKRRKTESEGDGEYGRIWIFAVPSFEVVLPKQFPRILHEIRTPPRSEDDL